MNKYNRMTAWVFSIALVGFIPFASAKADVLIISGTSYYTANPTSSTAPLTATAIGSGTVAVLAGPAVHPASTKFATVNSGYGISFGGTITNLSMKINERNFSGSSLSTFNVSVSGYPGAPQICYASLFYGCYGSAISASLTTPILHMAYNSAGDIVLVFPNSVSGNVEVAKVSPVSFGSSPLNFVMSLGPIATASDPIRHVAGLHPASQNLYYLRENLTTGTSTLYAANLSSSSLTPVATYTTSGFTIKSLGIDSASGVILVRSLSGLFEVDYAYFPAPLYQGELAAVAVSTALAGYSGSLTYLGFDRPYFVGSSLYVRHPISPTAAVTLDKTTFGFGPGGLSMSTSTHPINLPTSSLPCGTCRVAAY